MRATEVILIACDGLCEKLVDKELWDLSKDAERLRAAIVKHAENLDKFIELVEQLDASAL